MATPLESRRPVAARWFAICRARRWATSHGAIRQRLAWAGHRRPFTLPYIAGIAETCRPGISHGNQIASAPIATSDTPTAWPNGFP
jgi:hypothetical protein